MSTKPALRIGYVPEHFSTPLHFAQKYYGLDASLIPFPSGTGHMITSLRENSIDVGIGLTEGWVAGLGTKPKEQTKEAGYKIVGTYVETPLCWAISTGINRKDIKDVSSLKDGKIGVSRIGSGSYVMGFVLADKYGWLKPPDMPFEVVPCQTFLKLREAVNNSATDFFMWEHFTSKRYYGNGEIRRVGEIYTPWSSWKIVARDEHDTRLPDLFEKLNEGVKHFEGHQDEAIEYISTELDYSKEDAKSWLSTVKFAKDVQGVKRSVIEETVKTLQKAGVLADDDRAKLDEEVDDMIGVNRAR